VNSRIPEEEEEEEEVVVVNIQSLYDSEITLLLGVLTDQHCIVLYCNFFEVA